MRIPIAAAAVMAALFLFTACSSKDAPPSPSATAASNATAVSPATGSTGNGTSTATAFEVERALQHIQQLAGTIGPRVAGTASEERAAEYIRDQFAEAGYSATLEPFTFDQDPYRAAGVQAEGQELSGLAMAGTAAGSASGAAVYVGLADGAGIAGRSLAGQVAVADRGTLTFGDKLDNVRKAGAVALIVINNAEGEFSGNLPAQADIPVVGVAKAAGETLKAAAAHGDALTVKVTPGGQGHGANVLARPTAGQACTIIVGGHFDTVPAAPGAHDNASGTATVIELARTFAADGLDPGLCFAAFSGEESGLHGSQAMVAALRAQGALPKVMLNFDETGVGTRVDLIGTASLTGQALTVAQQLGVDAEVVQLGAQYGSDHMSFEGAGVPVLFFATNDTGKMHTPQDTVDTISRPMLQASGTLAYAVLKQLYAQVARG